MSLNLYDTSIVTKLRTLMGNNNIYIVPPDELFRIMAKVNDDTIQMPMISLTRTGASIDLSRNNHYMKFEGALVDYDYETNISKRLQAIPLRINYLMDIWTKSRIENDEILGELIFYFMTHPTLKVLIPKGLNINHNFNLFFNSDIDDNSDIVAHKDRGVYFRQTLSIYTDDAYLWKSSTRKPIYITDASLELMDNNGNIIETESIYEDSTFDEEGE